MTPKPPPVWPFPTWHGKPYKPRRVKVPRPVLPDAPF